MPDAEPVSADPSPGPASPPSEPDGPVLPYQIACLCDLRDERGRLLLIERRKAPNDGLFSPIGGKLEMPLGESPARCARREIQEEAGIDVAPERLRLVGMIAERAFEGRKHWLIFYYRVMGPVAAGSVRLGDIGEGDLAWHEPDAVDGLALPETDRRVIWPLVRRHEATGPDGGPGFFSVAIDCTDGGLRWTVEQETATGG